MSIACLKSPIPVVTVAYPSASYIAFLGCANKQCSVHTLVAACAASLPSSCPLPLLLLQAKALGDVLVVGLIPDSEILRCKGPPVLNEHERYLLVDAVKWVDEVIQGVMKRRTAIRAGLAQGRCCSLTDRHGCTSNPVW